MRSHEKSERLGLLIIAVTIIPFWTAVMWLTGFFGWCRGIIHRISELPIREFLDQPLSPTDLVIVAPWILLAIVLLRRTPRQPVLPMYLIVFGDPKTDFEPYKRISN